MQIDGCLAAKEFEYNISNQEIRSLDTTLYYRDKPYIAKVSSPPMITIEAAKAGSSAGLALDLTVRRPDVKHWDSSNKSMRDDATKLVLESEPFMLRCSPPCTILSILQKGNRGISSKESLDDKLRRAQVHNDFSLKLFEIQRRCNICDLYEHPRTASSWKLKGVRKLIRQPDTIRVFANMCQFGMTKTLNGQVGMVKKLTTYIMIPLRLQSAWTRDAASHAAIATSTLPFKDRERGSSRRRQSREVDTNIKPQRDERRCCDELA